MDFEEIEIKYKTLINKAIDYMKKIEDKEHDINHMQDVVNYTKILLNNVKLNINYDVCIISAYWHDVGRFFTNEGHEKLSAELLKKEMLNMNYSLELIDMCFKAIEKHKWNMKPETLEGLIIKDADKLDFIGVPRWKNCIDNNQNINSIIQLLPDLREKYLYFEESKKIYDQEIVKLLKYLYYNN